MQVQPYLFFEGRAEEAAQFYQRVVGAKVDMKMHYKDAPDPAMVTPASADKIMHMSLRVGDSVLLMSDGHCQGNPSFAGFSLSLTCASEAEAKRLFDALSEGGQIRMPLGKTFFSPAFGMLADRFGVGWMVYVAA